MLVQILEPTVQFKVYIKNIIDGFICFRGTIFETGIDAAFASHKTNEACFFKEEYYARVTFTPGTTYDYIMDGA